MTDDRVWKQAEEAQMVRETALSKMERLQNRVAQLEQALSFYADPDTYCAMTIMTDPPCGEFADDFSDDHGGDYDRPMPGKCARAALYER